MSDDDPRARRDGDGAGEQPASDAAERRTTDDPDEQPTVTIGSEGFRPDEEGPTGERQGSTAALEEAVPAPDGEFGSRGWLLVSVVVVCFLVLPVVVTLRPVRILGFRTTYLLLPLVPAAVLGATAVWVAVRSRR